MISARGKNQRKKKSRKREKQGKKRESMVSSASNKTENIA